MRKAKPTTWNETADVVVVGAGFGGLGAALTLAEGGARVSLLEALNYPGGCASTFERDGYQFEAGATLFSGFGEGQLMRTWLDRHELDVPIDWLDPVIELRAPGLRLPVDRDRSAFVDRMCSLGDEPQRVRRFFDRQRRVADILWELFDDARLLPPFDARALMQHVARSPRYLSLLPLLGRPLGALVERDGLAQHAALRIYLDALCQITVQASAAEAEAPFALAATDYAFRGTAHVRGGVGRLAWALVDAVGRCGGSAHMATRVRSLRRVDGMWHVSTRRGVVTAPVVLANLLPQRIAELTDVHDDKLLTELSERLEDGWGAAMLYLGVESDALPHAGAHHLELIADPNRAFVEGNHVFCSISDQRETERAPTGQRTVTASTHLPMAKLLALPNDARGNYIAEVQQGMHRTIAALAPELNIRASLPASPRTFERFTGRPEGYVGGIPRRAGLHNYRGLFPTPVLDGLYMVGDTAFPGQSTLATAIGGMKTARHVLSNA